MIPFLTNDIVYFCTPISKSFIFKNHLIFKTNNIYLFFLPFKKNFSLFANICCKGMLSSIAIGPISPRNPPDIRYTGTFFCCSNPISSLDNKNFHWNTITQNNRSFLCYYYGVIYFTPGVKWNGWFLMKSRICCNDGFIIWSRAERASLKSILPDIALFVLKYVKINTHSY